MRWPRPPRRRRPCCGAGPRCCGRESQAENRPADAWMRANGTPGSRAETALIESATDAEGDLSAALRADSGPASAMMAALLQRADGTEVAVPLRLGLRERFLPADGGPGVP